MTRMVHNPPGPTRVVREGPLATLTLRYETAGTLLLTDGDDDAPGGRQARGLDVI